MKLSNLMMRVVLGILAVAATLVPTMTEAGPRLNHNETLVRDLG